MTAALVGFVCVATSAAILIALPFLPTGLDPIREVGRVALGLIERLRYAAAITRLIVVAASIL